MRGSTFLGAERLRRRGLAQATLAVISAGRSSRGFLRKLLATWVHVLLYRRLLLSLLSATFAFIGPVTDGDKVVVQLPSSVLLELARISVCSPLAVTNLAAEFLGDIFASDASQYGWGASSAPLPQEVRRELWRHRERRGAYTRLYG